MRALIASIVAAATFVGAGASALAEVVVPELPEKRELSSDQMEGDFQRARASMADAAKAFEAGQYETALLHAEAGYKLYPNSSTASVVAYVFKETGKLREAARWYLKALNLDPTSVAKDKLEEGLAEVGAKLEPPIGWLTVERRPKEARISVDGTRLPERVTVVGLPAGAHAVRVEAEGHAAAERTVEVTAGAGALVELELEEVVMPVEEPDDTVTIVGWSLVGTGAALAIAGGVVAGLAAADSENIDTRRQFYAADKEDVETRYAVGWGVLGAGAAVMIGGVIAVVVGSSGGDESSASTTVGVAPSRGGAMAVLQGRF